MDSFDSIEDKDVDVNVYTKSKLPEAAFTREIIGMIEASKSDEEDQDDNDQQVLLSPEKLSKLSTKVQAIGNADINTALDEFIAHDEGKEKRAAKREQEKTMKQGKMADYATSQVQKALAKRLADQDRANKKIQREQNAR